MALQSAGEIRLLVAHFDKAVHLDALRFAVDFEIERHFAAAIWRHAIDSHMSAQIVEVGRRAVTREIVGTRAGHMFERAELSRDQIRIGQFAELDAAIDSFGNQIDGAVADADGEIEIRIARVEVVERGSTIALATEPGISMRRRPVRLSVA